MKKNNNSGFSLVELLVVIAIIGLLSTMAIVGMSSARAKARETVALDDLAKFRNGILMMENEIEKWPNGCPPWSVRNPEIVLGVQQAGLLEAPAVGDQGDDCEWTQYEINKWNGPYVTEVGLDPWGNNYYFDPDYTPYANCGTIPDEPEAAVLVSFGPNGAGVNDYDCDDIFLKLK